MHWGTVIEVNIVTYFSTIQQGFTSLHSAAENGKIDVVKFLHSRGANIFAVTNVR